MAGRSAGNLRTPTVIRHVPMASRWRPTTSRRAGLALTYASGMWLGVLGPLMVRDERETPVSVTRRRQREVLCALALHTGRAVSEDRLVDALWRDRTPDGAGKTLRNYVSELRKLLGPAAIETVADGYRLGAVVDCVDAVSFEQVARSGPASSARPLWRGRPFVELDGWPPAEAEATRLTELFHLVEERCIEADLESGRHHEAVADIEGLVAVEPLRERRWWLLMLALYRSGRQADALSAFSRASRLLDEELGLRPGPALSELEAQILRHEPSLLVDRPPDRLIVSAADVPTPHVRSNDSPSRPASLPSPVTSFVGRQEERARLAEELPASRLVTLWGVGGVGKTRLAIEVARLAAESFADGVWWCELAPVRASAGVSHAVAATLSIRPEAGKSMSVLATSREPLGLSGERVWVVPSLVPATDGVELFSDRAAAADSAAAATEDNVAVIAAICERLDGLPLAIELAAARVRSMTPHDVADGLEDRFDLLRGGHRTDPPRHQTMHATVAWSHLLLDERARLLFERLAVFAGTFDLAAVGSVCADEALERCEVGEVLHTLVDKSMVVADRSGPHMRFRLLETLRHFGEEQLVTGGALSVLRDRHVDHFVAVAARACRQVKGHAYTEGMATFEAEWDNFRAVLGSLVAVDDAARASDLVETLLLFGLWRQRHELGQWAEELVAMRGAGASAFGVAARFAANGGDHARALQLAQSGLAETAPTTPSGRRLCWETKGRALYFLGRRAEAQRAIQTWGGLFHPHDEPFDAASASLAMVGFVADGSPSAMAATVARGRRLAAPLSHPVLDAMAAWATGHAEGHAGRSPEAMAHFRHALELAACAGNLYWEGWATHSIGLLAAKVPGLDAAPALQRALARGDAMGFRLGLWTTLEAVALCFADADRLEPAAVVLGHLEAHDIHHRGKGYGVGTFVERRANVLGRLRTMAESERWMARGAALNREELVDVALRALDDTLQS